MGVKYILTRSLEAYKEGVKRIFLFLKQTVKYNVLWVKNMPLLTNTRYLAPIANLHLADDELIRTLAK